MSSFKIQSLFQIGEYDSDEGELWDDNDDDSASSDDEGNQTDESWETESEHSIKVKNVNSNNSHDLDDSCMRSRLAASIERARIAMTKLENIFNDKSGEWTIGFFIFCCCFLPFSFIIWLIQVRLRGPKGL